MMFRIVHTIKIGRDFYLVEADNEEDAMTIAKKELGSSQESKIEVVKVKMHNGNLTYAGTDYGVA